MIYGMGQSYGPWAWITGPTGPRLAAPTRPYRPQWGSEASMGLNGFGGFGTLGQRVSPKAPKAPAPIVQTGERPGVIGGIFGALGEVTSGIAGAVRPLIGTAGEAAQAAGAAGIDVGAFIPGPGQRLRGGYPGYYPPEDAIGRYLPLLLIGGLGLAAIYMMSGRRSNPAARARRNQPRRWLLPAAVAAGGAYWLWQRGTVPGAPGARAPGASLPEQMRALAAEIGAPTTTPQRRAQLQQELARLQLRHATSAA